MPAEDILIDFQVDYSQLDNALATLEKTGTIDSKIAGSFKQTTAAVKGTTTQTKDLVQTFKDVKGAATIMGTSVKKAFDAGVNDALKQAGVSTKEFEEDLKKAATAPASLRQELKNLTQAIAEAKVNGTDLGEEFNKMRSRAGELKDAIADSNTEISNAGSDTRGIDNVIGSVSALAGGFAVAQGAAALFGEENEDVQKALLKVNSALAISQGIQQVSNALQKEGSLIKLADATATGFQTAAQRIYTAVTGKATAATKGFKAALLATGIGAIITLVLALADAFGVFDDAVDDTSDSFARLNKDIDRNIELSNKLADVIAHRGKIALDDLKLQNATEGQLQKQSVQTLRDQQQVKYNLLNEGNDRIIALERKHNEKLAAIDKQLSGLVGGQVFADATKKKLQSQFDAEIKETRKKNDVLRDDAQRLGDEIQESNSGFRVEEQKRNQDDAKKSVELRKKAIEDARKAKDKELQDDLARLQIRLLEVEKNTQAEIDIEKKIIEKKSQIDLNAAELTKHQKELIVKQALQDQLDIQREFNTKLNTEQLQARIDNNAAELAELNITNEEKLRLIIENIDAAAQIEIFAAKGNASKIAEITAKQLADANAAKRESIEKSLEDEISLNNLRTAAGRRALERIISDEKKAAEERIAAIKSIENAEVNELDKRLASLKTEHEQALISEEEFTKKFEELLDRRSIIIENANDRIKGVNDKAKKDDDERWAFTTQNAIDTANQVADFFGQLNALSADQENQRIAGQKKQLQQLIDAGAITKKDAEIRGKQIEIQEQQLRQRQAQRDKQLALFNAIINTAAAITKALPNIPLVAIAAAIGAAQIALIAARPIPKFAKGKKGNYSGPGEVGEAGQELVEHGGRMFLTTKPTVMYLGPKDKVFTPKETRQMLHNTDKVPVINNNQSMKIDYDKLAQSLAKNQKPPVLVDFHKDYISDQVAQGLSKNNYFVNRYRI